mgnify:CR=1 FL=1
MDNIHTIRIPESRIIEGAKEGMDTFIRTFTTAYWQAVGGELTTETMERLTAEQLTLLGYVMLHDEVMDGGFVQLIHNGYGPFFFENPFAKSLKLWGLRDLSKLIYEVYPLYKKKCEVLTKECSEDEFMELFEQHPEFDDYDDEFVENEEEYTELVARYVDEHIEQFAEIVKE